jgi:hypothetical protein
LIYASSPPLSPPPPLLPPPPSHVLCTNDRGCLDGQSCCNWDNEITNHTYGVCAEACILYSQLSPPPLPPAPILPSSLAPPTIPIPLMPSQPPLLTPSALPTALVILIVILSVAMAAVIGMAIFVGRTVESAHGRTPRWWQPM